MRVCICVFTLDVTLDDVCVCGAQTGLWMWCEVMCVCTCACQRGKCAGVESVLVGAWFMSVNIHSGCLKTFSVCASVSCYSICSAPFLCLLDKFEENESCECVSSCHTGSEWHRNVCVCFCGCVSAYRWLAAILELYICWSTVVGVSEKQLDHDFDSFNIKSPNLFCSSC